jgi:hypothetical protein
MNRHTLIFIAITIFMYSGVWLIHLYNPASHAGLSTWIALSFLVLMSWVVHRVLHSASSQRPQRFITLFMATVTAKLFLSAIAILIAGLIEPEYVVLTALSYMAGYLAYTVAEIVHLLPLFKNTTA